MKVVYLCFLISNTTLCNIFQQNSTNPIVTSNGFQFGYIFVTVMLHTRKKENELTILSTRPFHLFIYVQLTMQILFSHLHLE
ncbi:hypothetical protein FO497_13245 [Bacillus cereus ATCC 10876]|uniref:Uncharacterized protein n=1 Tax=Bacillus thuringiensis TaxID=1428 RepID=A0AAW4HX33_BACTU|nr:hypothetical protein [Bacillus thuringiensis]MDR4129815.1 hypothetical protein [Bacillus cereus ATCC 10876]PFR86234.1 hypothetical protein COK42_04845 [Bacillus cereus]TKH58018.1 hypothetical protein FC680_16975 [Bacillus cereus]TKH88328.1 hypothetical protein FC685_15705 [Bacillus cereus]